MFNSKFTLLLAGLSFLIFTACSPQTTQQATDSVDTAVEQTKEKAAEAGKTAEEGVQTAKDAASQGAAAVDKAVEGGKSAVSELMVLKDSINEMKGGATQTLEAVQAADFPKAIQEFDKLKTTWTNVEEKVKTKSAETYTKVQESIQNADTLLKAQKPDAAQLTSALETLQATLAKVSF